LKTIKEINEFLARALDNVISGEAQEKQ